VGDSVSSRNEALGSLLALDGKSSARVSRSGLICICLLNKIRL
jgi:hypothetical protein